MNVHHGNPLYATGKRTVLIDEAGIIGSEKGTARARDTRPDTVNEQIISHLQQVRGFQFRSLFGDLLLDLSGARGRG
jgi:ABC-type branched-subunit amino acid transport system ATPase component